MAMMQPIERDSANRDSKPHRLRKIIKPEIIGSATPMRYVAIGTNGIIAIGGSKTAIPLFSSTGGYYFLDASYWYPAWGYDPSSSYYDYDGPIYTYGNLLPDQVIANVQGALQDAGYYSGAVTGSLSVETRAALVNFQRDQGLIVTGAIDEPTVAALGLY